MTVEAQAQRIARFKRTELLDAAVDELTEVGWRGLQMQAVAKRVGVSRQTVYNAFSGRDGLAAAIVEHLTDSFLTGFEAAFLGKAEPFAQWMAGIHYLLSRGSNDPAVRAMVGGGSADQFLELLTSGSDHIVASARHRITAVALRCQPTLDPHQVSDTAEIISRLTLSNIVQPMRSVQQTAATMATMITAFLAGPGAHEPAPSLRPPC